MKLTVEDIIILHNIIATAKLGRMAVEDKRRMIDMVRALRAEVTRWQEFKADAASRLDKAEASAVTDAELHDDRDIDLPQLSAASLDALMDANPSWTTEVVDFLDRVLTSNPPQ